MDSEVIIHLIALSKKSTLQEKIIDAINKDLSDLYFKQSNLEYMLETKKSDYLRSNEPKCPEYRLVKLYTSIEDLENSISRSTNPLSRASAKKKNVLNL